MSPQVEDKAKRLCAIDQNRSVLESKDVTLGLLIFSFSVVFSSHQSYKLAVELKPDQSQAWMNMGGIQHIKVGPLEPKPDCQSHPSLEERDNQCSIKSNATLVVVLQTSFEFNHRYGSQLTCSLNLTCLEY